jgi:hypothetical protein
MLHALRLLRVVDQVVDNEEQQHHREDNNVGLGIRNGRKARSHTNRKENSGILKVGVLVRLETYPLKPAEMVIVAISHKLKP